jgi:hypothetical protein
MFGVASALSYVTNLVLGMLLCIIGQDPNRMVLIKLAELPWRVPGEAGSRMGDADIWVYRLPFYSRRRCRCILPWCYIDGEILGLCLRRSRVHEVELDWRIRTAFRLLGAFPVNHVLVQTWA